jgi:hypothetical protein
MVSAWHIVCKSGGMTMLADLVRDFRYAARSVLRTPSFAVAVVVSERFWLRRLAGDPAAVGRTIALNGSPHLVVGVVPRDFRFPRGDVDVFVPTTWAPEVLAQESSNRGQA